MTKNILQNLIIGNFLKTSCLFFFLFILSFVLKAQDKIYKTDSTIIVSKVIEITDGDIKYKNFNNQNGPLYTISIPEVHMIVYQNGEKEIYNALKVKKPTTVASTQTTTPVTSTTVNQNTSTINNTNNTQNPKAKKGPYFVFGPGYGINSASQQFDFNITSDTASADIEEVHGSFGKGLNFGVGFGVMLHENVSFELGLNYLKSSSITTTNTNNSVSPAYVITNVRKASMLRIMPALVISAGDGKITPYARVGLVVGMACKITPVRTETGSKEIVKKFEYSGGIPLGFASSLGLRFGSGSVSCFGEFGMINQSWAPTKLVLKEYTYDGIDQLPGMTVSETETEYVDNYTNSPTVNDNVPAQSVKKYFPFSSFGINAGLRITF